MCDIGYILYACIRGGMKSLNGDIAIDKEEIKKKPKTCNSVTACFVSGWKEILCACTLDSIDIQEHDYQPIAYGSIQKIYLQTSVLLVDNIESRYSVLDWFYYNVVTNKLYVVCVCKSFFGYSMHITINV